MSLPYYCNTHSGSYAAGEKDEQPPSYTYRREIPVQNSPVQTEVQHQYSNIKDQKSLAINEEYQYTETEAGNEKITNATNAGKSTHSAFALHIFSAVFLVLTGVILCLPSDLIHSFVKPPTSISAFPLSISNLCQPTSHSPWMLGRCSNSGSPISGKAAGAGARNPSKLDSEITIAQLLSLQKKLDSRKKEHTKFTQLSSVKILSGLNHLTTSLDNASHDLSILKSHMSIDSAGHAVCEAKCVVALSKYLDTFAENGKGKEGGDGYLNVLLYDLKAMDQEMREYADFLYKIDGDVGQLVAGLERSSAMPSVRTGSASVMTGAVVSDIGVPASQKKDDAEVRSEKTEKKHRHPQLDTRKSKAVPLIKGTFQASEWLVRNAREEIKSVLVSAHQQTHYRANNAAKKIQHLITALHSTSPHVYEDEKIYHCVYELSSPSSTSHPSSPETVDMGSAPEVNEEEMGMEVRRLECSVEVPIKSTRKGWF